MVDAHTNNARNKMELLRNVYGSQIHIFDNYIPFSVRMRKQSEKDRVFSLIVRKAKLQKLIGE